jgi:hypothetical protein
MTVWRGVVGLLVIVASCVGVEATRPGQEVVLDGERVLVFGRLRVSEGDRGIVPTPRFGDVLLQPGELPQIKLSLFRVESGRKALYPAYEDDGSFWWVVPRGTWLVFHTPPGPGAYNEVLAAFQTPRDAAVAYVGTLAMQIDTRAGDERGVEYLAREVEVLDDFEPARAALARRHPRVTQPVQALMITDPALAGLLGAWSRERCDEVLAAHGVRAFDR